VPRFRTDPRYTFATSQEIIDSSEALMARAKAAMGQCQAPSYMIGRLTILGLREQAHAALGQVFDIRKFHDQVRGRGRAARPPPGEDRVLDRRRRRRLTVDREPCRRTVKGHRISSNGTFWTLYSRQSFQSKCHHSTS
jgi:hypothetical protein